MKRKFLILLFFAQISFFLFSNFIFAQSNEKIFESYYKNGQLNIYASVGWFLGIIFSGTAELILGEWNIKDIMPVDYGIGLNGFIKTSKWTDYFETYIGIAPIFMIHIGEADYGIDNFIGVGVRFTTYKRIENYYYFNYIKKFEIGFTATIGTVYYISKNFGLTLEVVSFIGPIFIENMYKVGIQLKL